MDTQTNSINRVLQTLGQGKFFETSYTCPILTNTDIKVKAIFTGICRSDIDMMTGSFGQLPLHMQGHEGLGQVIEVGSDVEDVKVGDYVATRGEPAYADFYTVRENEYVLVPQAHPRYIIEPVACGINLVLQPLNDIIKRSGTNKNLLIIGTGFLAWVAFHTIKNLNMKFKIDVVGSSNSEIWKSVTNLEKKPKHNYDVIIDLGNSDFAFSEGALNTQGLLILGTQKKITTDFQNLLWKACTIVFPSPRTDGFFECMWEAVYMIQTGKINVDSFWTKGYNRDTEWQQAFQDGLNRHKKYSRGYLSWV
jgi:D-arabinose 1-dehydrogenase-like Zn-dependent alcohol dehydrogenase